MKKAKIKYDLKLARKIRAWQVLLLLILMLFITATLLRLNNIGMTSRLEAVLIADKENNQKQLDRRLYELKEYVFTHVTLRIDQDGGGTKIFFGTGPFYLEESYKRDAQVILDKVAQASATNPHGNVHKQVADVCDPLAQRYGWGYSQPYFDCFSRELAKFNATSEAPIKVELPNTEMYRLNYASPILTLDLVSLTIIISVILLLILLVKFIIWLTLHIILIISQKSPKKR